MEEVGRENSFRKKDLGKRKHSTGGKSVKIVKERDSERRVERKKVKMKI